MNLKIIKREYRHDWEVPDDYTGIVLFDGHDVCNFINGCKEWWVNGERHREDGPAIESNDGSKYWYTNGKKHREDGPAIENSNGSKFWFVDGKRHRNDGPAYETSNGTKFWYVEDKLHRLDGPAIEVSPGIKEWHINDVKLPDTTTSESFFLLVDIMKLKNLIK